MNKEIWELLTTFTEESQKAVKTKCQELGFNIDRGVVTLDEAFINLNTSSALLKDSIEKEKFNQIPISLQKRILAHIQGISTHQESIISGTDSIENLVNLIEKLYSDIWMFGLNNLSGEVLGYQEKLNQLKNMELEIKNLKESLNEGLHAKEKLDGLLDQSKEHLEVLEKNVLSSGEHTQTLSKLLQESTEANKAIESLATTISDNEEKSKSSLLASEEDSGKIEALKESIKEFFELIEEHKNKLNETTENAKSTVLKNNKETKTLTQKLRELENQIKDQMEKATGFSLFDSFQKRKEALAVSKSFWIKALSICVGASITLGTYLIYSTTGNFDTLFFIKLAISLPLIYAITFCSIQYSRERKLEEEYAFKSNISISLVPYKDLVEKLVTEENASEKEKYVTFIIETINKVFTSPIDKIFDGDKKNNDIGQKSLKELTSLIKELNSSTKN